MVGVFLCSRPHPLLPLLRVHARPHVHPSSPSTGATTASTRRSSSSLYTFTGSMLTLRRPGLRRLHAHAVSDLQRLDVRLRDPRDETARAARPRRARSGSSSQAARRLRGQGAHLPGAHLAAPGRTPRRPPRARSSSRACCSSSAARTACSASLQMTPLAAYEVGPVPGRPGGPGHHRRRPHLLGAAGHQKKHSWRTRRSRTWASACWASSRLNGIGISGSVLYADHHGLSTGALPAHRHDHERYHTGTSANSAGSRRACRLVLLHGLLHDGQRRPPGLNGFISEFMPARRVPGRRRASLGPSALFPGATTDSCSRSATFAFGPLVRRLRRPGPHHHRDVHPYMVGNIVGQVQGPWSRRP